PGARRRRARRPRAVRSRLRARRHAGPPAPAAPAPAHPGGGPGRPGSPDSPRGCHDWRGSPPRRGPRGRTGERTRRRRAPARNRWPRPRSARQRGGGGAAGRVRWPGPPSVATAEQHPSSGLVHWAGAHGTERGLVSVLDTILGMEQSQRKPLTASIYVRISRDKSGDQVAISRQLEACQRLIRDRGWTVGPVFEDNDLSATSGVARPAFERLLASSPEAIVAWHQDRLLRTTRDLERVIDLGVNVYMVEAGHVDLSHPAGRAVARTVAAWSTYEGEQRALRQKLALQDIARKGRPWWA